MTTPGLPLSALLADLPHQSEPGTAPTADPWITGLALDSRRVKPGDLFLALAGRREHGLVHAAHARARGAVAVAYEASPDHPPAPTALPAVAIPALSRHCAPLAARFYGDPAQDMQIIGVTGTDGKTSVSHFLAQALHQPDQPCGLLGTLGYGLPVWPIGSPLRLTPLPHTTPDPVTLQACLADLRAQGVKRVVMEASSHALDQERLAGITIAVAVLTHLSRDHLDYHGDLASYAAAKAKLFQRPEQPQAVLNLDDAFGRELAAQLPPARVFGYGLTRRGERPAAPAHCWPQRYSEGQQLYLSEAGVRLNAATATGKYALATELLGVFNAYNMLATFTALLALDLPPAQAAKRLPRLSSVPGRMQRIGQGARPVVVVDYAHTPAALTAVLQALQAHCRGRLSVVCGCGGERDRGKRPLLAAAAEAGADQVILTDDNPRGEAPARIVADMLAGCQAPQAVTVIHDRPAAIATAIAMAAAKDTVLIAGKGHETVQIIGDHRLPCNDAELAAAALARRAEQVA